MIDGRIAMPARRRGVAALALSMAAFLVGALLWQSPASAQETEWEQMKAAEALWAEVGPDTYILSYSREGDDPEPPRLDTVAGGEVIATSSPIQPLDVASARTVADLFWVIRSAINSGYFVDVWYDNTLGLPKGIWVTEYPDGYDGSQAPVQEFFFNVYGLISGTTVPVCDGKQATILGTEGRDVFRGSLHDDVIVTLGGDDLVLGGGGDDTICAGTGDDVVHGDRENEPTGNDVIFGGPGRDRLYGSEGDDVLNGGGAIDHLYGGDGIDTLRGDAGSDRMWGGRGHDVLWGDSGADRMWGGDGDDEMFGQGGQDQMWGGPGNDTMQGNWQSDRIFGGDGDDTIGGAEGKDVLVGGAGVDTMYGGNNSDLLSGGLGDDVLSGGAGQDQLFGAGGANAINGGPHTDTCYRTGLDSLNSCQQRVASWPDGEWTLIRGMHGRDAIDLSGRDERITMTVDGASISGILRCSSYLGTKPYSAAFGIEGVSFPEPTCYYGVSLTYGETIFFDAFEDVTWYRFDDAGLLRLTGPGSELVFERR